MGTYPVGRFANEFGFCSMPSALTWAGAAPADEQFYESRTVVDHSRHYPFGAGGDSAALSRTGIAEMTAAVRLYLPVPDKRDAGANFTAWCWSTQVVQVDDIAHQIAFYRRGSGMRERQMGGRAVLDAERSMICALHLRQYLTHSLAMQGRANLVERRVEQPPEGALLRRQGRLLPRHRARILQHQRRRSGAAGVGHVGSAERRRRARHVQVGRLGGERAW
ncbi:hypothetical protein C8J57DRAFT_149991 [Mycena rebaudengoi]|nr:hypothetical protein C8J57DRAFT_149991 [Mycena rebaudengoi]